MSLALSKSFAVAFAATKTAIYTTSRSISHHSWKGKPAYKASSAEQQYCIDRAFDAAKELGFDDHGAVEGQITGGLHNHNPGGTGSKWLTITYLNAQGQVLHHRKVDGTMWDRIHIYDDPAINLTAEERPVEIWAEQ